MSSRAKSRIVGQGSFDVAGGFFSKLKVSIRDEAEFDGMSIAQIFEVNLTRVPGNIYNIGPLPPRVVANPNPDPNPNPPIVQPGMVKPAATDLGDFNGLTRVHGGANAPQIRDERPTPAFSSVSNSDSPRSSRMLKAVRPIYRTSKGVEVMGKQFGTNLSQVVTAKAKPGYAVGAVNVSAGLWLDGIAIVYMKIANDGRLDPKDSYFETYGPWAQTLSCWAATAGRLSALSARRTRSIARAWAWSSRYSKTPGPRRVLGPVPARDPVRSRSREPVCSPQPQKSGTPVSYMHVESSPGGRIGQGKTYDYAGGQLKATANPQGAVLIKVEGWTVNFAGPKGRMLQVGEYAGATRYPFQKDGSPGLNFSGNGRGSNTVAGEFVVWELEINNGQIVRLAIDFTQRSEGKGPPLTGRIRINSNFQ